MSAHFDRKSPFASGLTGSLPKVARPGTEDGLELFVDLRANGWAIYAGHYKNGTARVFGVVRDESMSLETGELFSKHLEAAERQLQTQGYALVYVEKRLYSDESGKVPFERSTKTLPTPGDRTPPQTESGE